MIEIIFSVCLIIGFLGLLTYLYFHDREERQYIKKLQTELTNLPLEMQKFYTNLANQNNERSQKIIGESFKSYLKHIEKLERMVLPKPVTTRDVQSVLDRTGEISDMVIENDIEKSTDMGVEIPDPGWASVINADTKVAFDDGPTMVEN